MSTFTGKNHGPYSIDQLRQYVQAGNFRDDHLACYDGTNWVKIKDVPGLMVQAKKPKPAPQKAPAEKFFTMFHEIGNPEKGFRICHMGSCRMDNNKT